MKQMIFLLSVITSLMMAGNTLASSENRAVNACKNKIKSIYAVDSFRHVEADKTGHHKYDVHGKVKYNGEKRHFNCRIKNDHVRSYHYEGPHKEHKNDHDSHKNRNIAIGVGVAALAAILIAKNRNKSDDDDNDYSEHVSKENLEDNCHDAISRRIKDNYHSIRRVRFKHDSISHNNRKAEGDGRIVYRDGDRTDFDFSCHFNRNGRVNDTSYSIY